MCASATCSHASTSAIVRATRKVRAKPRAESPSDSAWERRSSRAGGLKRPSARRRDSGTRALVRALPQRPCWRLLPALTFCRSAALAGPSPRCCRRISLGGTGSTSRKRSSRSRRGPDNRPRYARMAPGLHSQRRVGWPQKPHGQGFIAATRSTTVGYVTVPLPREIVIRPSSSGSRRASSGRRKNSANSSRKRTPRWARVISPGRGIVPPPTSPA